MLFQQKMWKIRHKIRLTLQYNYVPTPGRKEMLAEGIEPKTSHQAKRHKTQSSSDDFKDAREFLDEDIDSD